MMSRLAFASLGLVILAGPVQAQMPEESVDLTPTLTTPQTGEEDLLTEGELGEAEEEPVLEVKRWRQYETATLRGLDKITGRSTDFEMKVGEMQVFGSLQVDLQVCFQTPPDFPPESAAFLQVKSLTPMDEAAEEEPEPMIFSGWMFASSPGLNALEHPVYDIWVIHCAKGEAATPGE